MELGLSLGDSSKPFSFLEKTSKISKEGFSFSMGLGDSFNGRSVERENEERGEMIVSANRLPVQLDLLPLNPVLPWPTENENPKTVSSSPNSTVSSFQMEFSIYRGGNNRETEAMVNEVEIERASSRASDDEENGLTRKKLRLSKEQSAFLEESFKEHNTLNPKEKLALAKQLDLRPRQVEVWFQNRRARTKLKQTEVDCEYLKRCCETLTEENKRLQKELQELRALKSSQPFYRQIPATTLTMCPSCERVSTNSTNLSAINGASNNSKATLPFSLSKPRFLPSLKPMRTSQLLHEL